MATIKFEGEEKEIEDGSKVLEAAEELGVPFGCQDGVCGTCMATVVDGKDNLEPLNEKEEEMDMAKGQRLVCQCKIVAGSVEFSLD
jgi:ferredoxin